MTNKTLKKKLKFNYAALTEAMAACSKVSSVENLVMPAHVVLAMGGMMSFLMVLFMPLKATDHSTQAMNQHSTHAMLKARSYRYIETNEAYCRYMCTSIK